jgi:hypothetical protein
MKDGTPTILYYQDTRESDPVPLLISLISTLGSV